MTRPEPRRRRSVARLQPWRLAALLLGGLLLGRPELSLASMVRLQTPLGNVDLRLFDDQAPLTVANFLGYLQNGAYHNSFLHRSVPGFVIQGGGYTWDNGPVKIPAGEPVVNEFSAERSNLRGTIAMAKLAGNPDSATSEWYFNLADNSANLDNQNGGFTVFGKVVGAGMEVVDAIAALPVADGGGAFSNLPLLQVPASGIVEQGDLVQISSATLLPTDPATNESDRLFNYLEGAYPQFISPASAVSAIAGEYYYRFYPATNAYVGTANGMLYYLGPVTNYEVTPLGTVAEWLELAVAEGY